MKGKMLTAATYPPPPPPPPPQSSKMDSRKLLVVALLIVIVVVSAAILFFLATNKPSTGGSTPTPTGTATPTPTGATPTPTGASPTATPSGTGTANFRTGWATYLVKSYGTGGEVTSQNAMKYAINEGTYSGTACWIMTVEMQMNQESGTMKTVMTYWISKSTLEGIHMKTQTYMNGELISEHEEDIEPGEGGDMPEPIDMSTTTSTETITVPAGTFTCGKITVTTPTGTSSTWVNSNIPVIGLVKIETTSGGAVASTTELTGYGG